MQLNHAGTKVTVNVGQQLRVRSAGNDYVYEAGDSRVLHRAVAAQLIADGVAT